MMNRFVGLIVLASAVAAAGCERQDAERLTRVGWKVADKLQGLVPDKTPWGASWSGMSDISLEGRVRARFEADKYLAPLNIEVIATDHGVRLRGRVTDEVLKRRAVELAESTVGVEKVADELSSGQ
jgi:BON domain